MVERSLSMREALGSIPRFSTNPGLRRETKVLLHGELAHMVERALRMREALGSIPRFSTPFLIAIILFRRFSFG